ncbi:Mannose-6-phosphate isomerase [Candidatus Arthromitus sp. SFB-mouse-NL]|uniref:class I mannose-6-phosphate isomerase n=1 Tax=Candidatus Arthromitus sp. SFB-mouse-NL TaxID=1508644 RepID=UPI00049B3FF5|nr:class I mannose-6-phosphate isomerase [Candidatus Arthromitus sp. SFB-mouse-NL]AID44209.1 Mannose-6-phosphate isomerase [Candidatus Arthromitus sp. SFB-mouse-NL]
MSKVLKLNPLYMEKIWGYEKWILSTHKNGISFVDSDQRNLLECIGRELPILIKEIKANNNLSVQVHPSDDYANKYENDFGKTECWYVLDADKDATLICGLKDGVTKEDFKNALECSNVEVLLKRINVKVGDMIYIPAGTVHAIEGGIKILEIQQCSDVTYRIYDWGRDREVHIDKALDVINFNSDVNYGRIENFTRLESPYFIVEKLIIDGEYIDHCGDNYCVYICLNGSGTITMKKNGNAISISELDTIYISQNIGCKINGSIEVLKVVDKITLN